MLGAKYHIMTTVLDAHKFGNPVYRRRQYSVAMHRHKVKNPSVTLEAFSNLFFRTCNITWHDLVMASDAAVIAELQSGNV